MLYFTKIFLVMMSSEKRLILLHDEIGRRVNNHQKLIGNDMPVLEWALPKEIDLCFSRRQGEKMFNEIENLHDDFIMSGQ